MNWFKLSVTCTIVYLVGFIFDQPDTQLFWFLSKSTLSLIIIAAALSLRTRTSFCIALLETGFMGLTFIAALQYQSGSGGNIYHHYEHILTAAAIAELLLLIWGTPWGGIRRVAESLGAAIAHRLPAGWLRDVGGFKNARSMQAQMQAK